MPNNRMPAKGTDARAMKRNRPTAAGIAAAWRYWQQSFAGIARPRPPDPRRDKARDQAGFIGADRSRDSADSTPPTALMEGF